jgi:hypothetical protein
MANMQHYLRLGPTGIGYRLPDDLDVEDFRRRVSIATTPLPVEAVSEDGTRIPFSLDPAVTPWWSVESESID